MVFGTSVVGTTKVKDSAILKLRFQIKDNWLLFGTSLAESFAFVVPTTEVPNKKVVPTKKKDDIYLLALLFTVSL